MAKNLDGFAMISAHHGGGTAVIFHLSSILGSALVTFLVITMLAPPRISSLRVHPASSAGPHLPWPRPLPSQKRRQGPGSVCINLAAQAFTCLAHGLRLHKLHPKLPHRRGVLDQCPISSEGEVQEALVPWLQSRLYYVA
eukprot:1159641-Pelagomonas_calceolata.AAC.7